MRFSVAPRRVTAKNLSCLQFNVDIVLLGVLVLVSVIAVLLALLVVSSFSSSTIIFCFVVSVEVLVVSCYYKIVLVLQIFRVAVVVVTVKLNYSSKYTVSIVSID